VDRQKIANRRQYQYITATLMQYRDGDGDGDGDGDMPANTIEWVNAIGVGNLRKGKGVGQPILA